MAAQATSAADCRGQICLGGAVQFHWLYPNVGRPLWRRLRKAFHAAAPSFHEHRGCAWSCSLFGSYWPKRDSLFAPDLMSAATAQELPAVFKNGSKTPPAWRQLDHSTVPRNRPSPSTRISMRSLSLSGCAEKTQKPSFERFSTVAAERLPSERAIAHGSCVMTRGGLAGYSARSSRGISPPCLHNLDRVCRPRMFAQWPIAAGPR